MAPPVKQFCRFRKPFARVCGTRFDVTFHKIDLSNQVTEQIEHGCLISAYVLTSLLLFAGILGEKRKKEEVWWR